mmetsp:Transcript_10528/g.21073  ORF Transcript_10528/g.21073 Transcript_10528/m.21073 type:complete len:382 (+) Transcript_10528:492-1637(+)
MMGGNNNQEENAEEMKRAFEAFMLAGKNKNTQPAVSSSSSAIISQSQQGKKKKKKKKSSSLKKIDSTNISSQSAPIQSTPSKPSNGIEDDASCEDSMASPSIRRGQLSQKQQQSVKKRYYQLLRSFADKVQHSWIDIDDQLLSVVQNIVSIRSRLRQEWSLLNSPMIRKKAEWEATTEERNRSKPLSLDAQDGGDPSSWKYFGFQGKPREDTCSFHLLSSDVRLALLHDLDQHEKMIAGLRTLMSNLAECHDSLGRLVGNVWQYHLESGALFQRDKEGQECFEDDDKDYRTYESIVQGINEVFDMLSMELYRKQCLAPAVIDSTDDELLDSKDGYYDDNGFGDDRDSLQIARECCKSWSRKSGCSLVNEHRMFAVLNIGNQ